MSRCLPERRTADLRKGRISLKGSRYFVTCAAVRPTCAFVGESCANALTEVTWRIHHDGDVELICATIMPDHVHFLFRLGVRLSLDRVVAKIKGLSGSALRTVGARWQENFYEHRLRPEELLMSYVRYVFMNPYRLGLVGPRVEWPYWMSGKESEPLIKELAGGKYPPFEWICEPPQLPESVVGMD